MEDGNFVENRAAFEAFSAYSAYSAESAVSSENAANDYSINSSIGDFDNEFNLDKDLEKIGDSDYELILNNHCKIWKKLLLVCKILIISFFLIFYGFTYLNYLAETSIGQDRTGRAAITIDDNFFLKKHNFNPLLSFLKEGEDPELILNQPPRKVFDVSLPVQDFGEPVYSQFLLQHTFGNSWGKPAIVDYNLPSNLDFNKVILYLNTSVSGVQYDRLAHIFLDGVSIWRTSTIEPGGRSANSQSLKDLSEYSNLFKKNGNKLMFQLDNLLTDRLNGSFDISLSANYYKVEDSKIDDKADFFTINQPADKIWSVVKPSDPSRPPLVYEPTDKLISILPKFHQNTTRAKIHLFTSGNAGEEFWYSNVLDEYKDIFKDNHHELVGHGPCRVVNVYLDNLKIATIAPEPVIFTGGFSPALWSPLVSFDAFDLKALEIELTPILPLLWSKSSSKLQFQISNCLDDNPKTLKKSSIGQNWITTANILTWESQDVVHAEGEFLNSSFTNSSNVVALQKPFSSGLIQITNTHYKNYIQGFLKYTLNNGSTIEVISDASTASQSSNIQIYQNYGDTQHLISDISSHNSFSVVDALNPGLILSQTNVSHKSPIVMKLDSKTNADEIDFTVDIVRAKSSHVNFQNYNIETSFKMGTVQNGTSKYHLSSKGNHGFGSTEQKLKAEFRSPAKKPYDYKRHVLAVNGTVIKDEVIEEQFENNFGKKDIYLTTMTNTISEQDDKDLIFKSSLSHVEKLYEYGLVSFELKNFFYNMLITGLDNVKQETEIVKENDLNSVDDGLIKEFSGHLFQIN
ncbi:hypothetical protein PACTADRAFT_44355 [Pachysolen tannophilus NRRL Y-2460]|uniref:Peptide N-acetyl-beta-D-glucosaminyl asparaginase amidase A N-terminal domain-containing protein n=1 Tax=Pachysolen tannophilus NRRL Y-2460 TaxID=669874 RepID=A0A1E4TRS5_PACTA|nr:hypothetical protein PACTADRAFT_44355 [Pachysolen tannophilus NRRL Y-2460]